MAGTNTATGNRSEGSIDKLARFKKSVNELKGTTTGNYAYGSRENEDPSQFLQQTKGNNLNELLSGLDQMRSRSAYDNNQNLQLGNQAANNALARGINAERARTDNAVVQGNTDAYTAQQKAGIETEAYRRKAEIDRTNQPTNSSVTNVLPGQDSLSRQRYMAEMQSSIEATKDKAQQTATERLARIQQQTAILSGGAGESTWRWF